MRVKGSIIVLAVLAGLASADFDAPTDRMKRFAATSCQMTPDNNVDKVIERSQAVKLSCNLDGPVQSCIWSHTEPLNEGKTTNDPDILCTGTPGETGRPCDSDTRVTFQSTSNQCGISISNTKPEDTGRWKLIAVGLSSDQAVSARKDFELYTYNVSYVRMTDGKEMDIKTVDTSYNWNTKKKEFEAGKGDYESLEFKCMAYGGRPIPKFMWYVDNNNNDGLMGVDGFQVTETDIASIDRYNYIRSKESRIQFRVDDKLLRRLEKYSINTNPQNGIISFELRCDVQQNLISGTDRPSIRINVRKTYDDGNLTAGTIGIIVGVVIAVILAVIAIALLVFAKSSGRWCFADDEEAYRKPQEAKPRSAGGPPAQSAQRQQRRQ